MSLFNRLHYYFIAMRKLHLATVACPLCSGSVPETLLRIDRYLLPIEVSTCGTCGMVYTSRNVSGTALQEFYRDHYRRFYENAQQVDRRYLFTHKPKLNAAFRMRRIREFSSDFDSVLEIGSGLGFFLDECRSLGIAHYHGLEPGDTFLDYSRTVLGLTDHTGPEPFEVAPSLPFQPDLAVMFHVLEHVEHPLACLRWLRDRISPDGMLVIEVPDITGDWSAMALGNFHIAHRWYFSPRSLYNMMVTAGWTPVLVQRDDGDGIYQGNLRMFAMPAGVDAAGMMPGDSPVDMAALVRSRVNLSSWKNGGPRAALRLARQALRP